MRWVLDGSSSPRWAFWPLSREGGGQIIFKLQTVVEQLELKEERNTNHCWKWTWAFKNQSCVRKLTDHMWKLFFCNIFRMHYGDNKCQAKDQRDKEYEKRCQGKKRPSTPRLVPKWRECDQMFFCIYRGVKVFSFCKKKNLLLTDGVDRIIRVWNPYLPG